MVFDVKYDLTPLHQIILREVYVVNDLLTPVRGYIRLDTTRHDKRSIPSKSFYDRLVKEIKLKYYKEYICKL